MSGLEVVGAVAAVVSAFHGGAELVAHIKKKHRRRSNKGQTQQEFEEKQLQDSLETGETQVVQRYNSDVQELGEAMRVGDAIARDRLLHIAVVMQAEIIKSLRLAVQNENAVINLRLLHEASIMNRKDSIVTLDEMKQRILITRPLVRSLPAPSEDQRKSRISVESLQTVRPASLTPVPDNYVPSAVTLPAPGESKDSKTGLARYFSMKRSNSDSSSSNLSPPPAAAVGTFPFSPALNQLLQGPDRASIMKDIDEIISCYQGLHMEDNKRDTLAILHGGYGGYGSDTYKSNPGGLNNNALQMLRNLPPTPEEAHVHSEYPAFNQEIFGQHPSNNPHYFSAPSPLPQRQLSTESRWSQSSSVYSDTIPPSLYSHDSKSSRESPTPPHAAEFSPIGSSSSPIQPRPPIQNSYDYNAPSHSFATPQDSSTPPNAAFGPTPPQHRSPQHSIQDDSGVINSSKARMQIVPDGSPTSSSSSASTIIASRPPVSQLAGGVLSPGLPPPPVPPKSPKAPHSRSNSLNHALAIRTNTIQGPIAGQETMMSGRPCKDNNYWGFCKGAWAVREDVKRGLQTQTRPDGMYNTHQVWQCRHCHFVGSTHTAINPQRKNKKEIVTDPSVHTSAVGIRYKWIFLAKSHVKKKTLESGRSPLIKRKGEPEEDCNYGCVICSVEGNVTGIYGNVETLMNHIFLEHVRTMSDRTLIKSRCIKGRKASVEEDWDLNIPMSDIVMS